MTIEINQPELEELIQKRLEEGGFRHLESLLRAALTELQDDARVEPEVRQEALRRMEQFANCRSFFRRGCRAGVPA